MHPIPSGKKGKFTEFAEIRERSYSLRLCVAAVHLLLRSLSDAPHAKRGLISRRAGISTTRNIGNNLTQEVKDASAGRRSAEEPAQVRFDLSTMSKTDRQAEVHQIEHYKN